MEMIKDLVIGLWESSGLALLTWQNAVMLLVSCVLLYFAIAKKCEPLLLVPIAFGILLANLPGAGIMDDAVGLFGGEAVNASENVIETSFGKTSLQRHLTALKAGTHTSACTGFLTLMTFTGGFTLTGACTSTDTLALFC